MRSKLQFFCVLLSLLAGISPSPAQSTTSFPIATNPAVVEFSGGMAFGGTNYCAIIVSGAGGANLSAQLFSTNGTLLGSPINIGNNAGFPPSAALAFGKTNYLVAWSDSSVGSGVDMFGQFISTSGQKIGSKFNLLSSPGAYGFQSVKALASDGTNFLLIWQDKNDQYFYGQLVTPAGVLSGPEFVISSQQQNGGDAAVTWGRTNYLVVWQSNNGVVGNVNETFGELVSQTGSAGSPFQISQTSSVDQNPLAVAFDGTNYLAVWPWDPGPETGLSVTNWDLHGAFVTPGGAPAGNEFVAVADPGSEIFPSLAFDGQNYLLTWGEIYYNSDLSFNPTNSNIYFQFFDSAGVATGPEFTVFTPQGTNTPFLARDGLIFDGSRYAMAGSLGTIATSGGNITGFPSGEVLGAFIPVMALPPPFTILHSFMAYGPNAATNGDGADSFAGLTLSGSSLYGTAANGGTFGSGTLFKAGTGATSFTNLYNFSALVGTNGIFLSGTNSDGANPYTGLIIANNMLYGTANAGGTNGSGTVFAVNTNGTGFIILHTFGSAGTNPGGVYTNGDGAGPNGLIASGNSLYGTTYAGGTNGTGTVFSLNLNGTGFAILHTFRPLPVPYAGTNSDGAAPFAGLILSGSTLFGTANTGGTNGAGTLFKLNTDGTGFATLYNFGGGDDGAGPSASLLLSGSLLYGTAASGGGGGAGTVFAINTNGTGFTLVHTFTGGNDGSNPNAALVLSGNLLYSTAVGAGGTGEGAVFAVNTNGTDFTVLHSFAGAADGANPYSGLTLSASTLYGTASGRGSGANGTIFSIYLGPTVQFTANPVAGLLPLNVQFNCPNVDSQGSAITSWNWNFGDGSTSTSQNPMHTYATLGTFSPSLVATNASGVAVPGSGPSVTVGNLVGNGGFEAGNLTDWNLSANTGGFTFADNGSIAIITPHSGEYFAALGTVGSPAYLSQTLTTVPGQTYLLSLWLNSPDGLTPNGFLVNWNGNQIFAQTNLPALGWTNLEFTVAATGTSTVLQFEFEDDPSYLGLDDVSLLPAAGSARPPKLTPLNYTNKQFSLMLAGTTGTNYVIQVSTNLSANNWMPVFTNAPVGGTFNFTDTRATNQYRFYRALQQ